MVTLSAETEEHFMDKVCPTHGLGCSTKPDFQRPDFPNQTNKQINKSDQVPNLSSVLDRTPVEHATISLGLQIYQDASKGLLAQNPGHSLTASWRDFLWATDLK